MTLWQRLRRLKPLMLLICAVAIASPWLFNFRIAYAGSPASWVLYSGSVFAAVGWLISGYMYEARRARDPDFLGLSYLAAFFAIGAIALTLIFLNNTIYFHGRMLVQGGAMERFVNGDDACPHVTQCVRDGDVTLFVWGARENLRTGACHDANARLVAFDRDTDARAQAGVPRAPQIFGGAVTIAQPRGGAWYECAISTSPRLVTPIAP